MDGQFHVISAVGADEAFVQSQIEHNLYMSHLVVIDTGPQDHTAQGIALKFSDFAIVVGSPAWGAERATKLLSNTVKKTYPQTPVLIIENLGTDYSPDEPGIVRIPRISDIEPTLRGGNTGRASMYADRILSAVGKKMGSIGTTEGPTVVAVIGGKGGVGKTTVATLIGLRIKEEGGVAALLDLDVQQGNISGVANRDQDLKQGAHIRWL
jgi:Mrp family chromosome partitioning ATPase